MSEKISCRIYCWTQEYHLLTDKSDVGGERVPTVNYPSFSVHHSPRDGEISVTGKHCNLEHMCSSFTPRREPHVYMYLRVRVGECVCRLQTFFCHFLENERCIVWSCFSLTFSPGVHFCLFDPVRQR